MESIHPSQKITLEDIPATAWMLATGIGFLIFGWALEWGGYGVEAGLSGALGLIFIVVAVLGHLLIWTLGKID